MDEKFVFLMTVLGLGIMSFIACEICAAIHAHKERRYQGLSLLEKTFYESADLQKSILKKLERVRGKCERNPENLRFLKRYHRLQDEFSLISRDCRHYYSLLEQERRAYA